MPCGRHFQCLPPRPGSFPIFSFCSKLLVFLTPYRKYLHASLATYVYIIFMVLNSCKYNMYIQLQMHT